MATLSIHHIGVAVEDLDEAVRIWTTLVGAAVEHRDRVPDQGVEAVSLRTGSGRVELLAPLEADTPVGRFLAKRGPGMHHVAFEVDDVAVELERLRRDGVQLIDERPRRGLFGLEVAFVHPESTGGVLAELVAMSVGSTELNKEQRPRLGRRRSGK
jgi:methylmalonyl-CoA epimerase